MATRAQGHADFTARVQRIETRGAGVSEVFNANITLGQPRLAGSRFFCIGCLVKIPLALAVGALAFVVAQYVTFLIGDIPEEFSNPDYILAGQSLLALVLVFFARLFFSLTAKTHFVLSIAGLVAAMSLMHNLVHIAPEPWAMVFSNGWVNEMRATAAPGTLHFRGTTIPLSQLTLG